MNIFCGKKKIDGKKALDVKNQFTELISTWSLNTFLSKYVLIWWIRLENCNKMKCAPKITIDTYCNIQHVQCLWWKSHFDLMKLPLFLHAVQQCGKVGAGVKVQKWKLNSFVVEFFFGRFTCNYTDKVINMTSGNGLTFQSISIRY